MPLQGRKLARGLGRLLAATAAAGDALQQPLGRGALQQCAAAAAALQANGAFSTQHTKPPRGKPAADWRSMVAAYVKAAAGQLSIPQGELAALQQRPAWSAEDVLAWAAARVAAHPATAAAAPHADRISRLRQLQARAAPWSAPRSPLELLLLRVGAGVEAARLAALSEERLRELPEFEVAAAALAGSSDGAEPGAEVVRAALIASAAQLLAAPPVDVLSHPAFWRHAREVVRASGGTALAQELGSASGGAAGGVALVRAALANAVAHGALLAALLGEGAAADAAALAAGVPLGSGAAAAWLEALAGGGGGGAARVAALRLAEWTASQLGLSTPCGCGADGDGLPAWEAVRRAGMVVPPAPELPASLTSAFQSSAPALVAALAQQPPASLGQGRIDFEQLLADGDASFETLASELRAWRTAQAAAGSTPALSSLSRSEVAALSEEAFEAVRARLAELGPSGRHAARLAMAAAAAGQAPLTRVLAAGGAAPAEAEPEGAPAAGQQQEEGQQGQDAVEDAAACQAAWDALQPLAWGLHQRGAAAAGELLGAALSGTAAAYEAGVASVVAAAAAISDVRTAFALEAQLAMSDAVTRPDRILSGELQQQVDALLPQAPKLRQLQATLYRGSPTPRPAADPSQGVLPALAALLQAPGSGGGGGAPSAEALLATWDEVRAQLASAPQSLPPALKGLFDNLLAAGPGGGDSAGLDAAPEVAAAAAAAAALDALQSKLAAFLAAWDAEVAATAEAGAVGVTTAPDGVRPPSWASAGASDLPGGLPVSGASAEAVAGLVELVGEEDAARLMSRGGGEARRRAAGRDGDGEEWQPYELLESVQRDIHIQTILATEFDPSLALDVVNAPLGWTDPRLSPEPAAWLDSMRPLLDAYLTAQGEAPTHDIEWKVYREVALTEAADSEALHEAGLRARGHSAFHNSAADAAFLRQRLQAGLPEGSVLRAAAPRYLDAVLANPTWTFAQRRCLVDRLLEVAAHLQQHPPRSYRGSPFSAVLQPDGPPLVPRLSRPAQGRRARRGVAPGVGVVLADGGAAGGADS
ncbi:hypothetical protein Rsub_12399 [Raphidocelis subcapitata]|uniref:Uncharacterized protein n=1 Tax=Raphidocelis subcapitata TaxID=307507 RepID=A0A2V0PJ01_9CHLO|nr:hypothetical protein Rsub_12399 [Raphidocelis subcapitata]|eukprot:GBF99771.1 hypothetical protein Rsub_12399 [Raphidocelis subcapitata]